MSGPEGSLPQDQGAPDPAVAIEATLAGLEGADLAAHADAFEAVNAAILDELQRLEAL